nr:hypothetical protein CFP56_58111 [Quercus suber]
MDRAYHLAEVFPLFGTTVELSKAPYVPEELEMGSYMRSAWAAFAHSPEDALSGSSLNWPRYDPNMNTTSLVLLGRDRELADFGARESYDALCN